MLLLSFDVVRWGLSKIKFEDEKDRSKENDIMKKWTATQKGEEGCQPEKDPKCRCT